MRPDSERLLKKHLRQEVRESRSAMRESARTFKTGAKLYEKGKKQYYDTVAKQMNTGGAKKGQNRWTGGTSKASRYRELDARAYMAAGSEMMDKGTPKKKSYGITRSPSWGGKKLKR